MKAKFVRVPPREWLLGSGIEPSRRDRLLHGPSFEGIISQVVEHSTIGRHKRAPLRRCQGYYRVEITLDMSATIVDLFHNSAGGYRAQYYHSAKNGQAANEYVVGQLVHRIMQMLDGFQKRTCPLWWVEQSLLQPDAKLWIHQGSWLRFRRLADRNLLVQRWLDYQWPEGERNKEYWARLTPEDETRIELKGGPLTPEGRPYGKSLKPRRATGIHNSGYT